MNKIEELLEESLSIIETAKEINAMIVNKPNVLISGLPGSGKTSITKEWAKKKGIPLVSYDLSRDLTFIYKEDEYGILRKVKAENPVDIAKQFVFDTLIKYKNKGDFILFLDDYHLATKENLEAIYYTMDYNKIQNPITKEEVELDNLLFTIAIKTDYK